MNVQRAKAGFVPAAGLSFVFSITLWFTGQKDQGMFVSLWVPSIFVLAPNPDDLQRGAIELFDGAS